MIKSVAGLNKKLAKEKAEPEEVDEEDNSGSEKEAEVPLTEKWFDHQSKRAQACPAV